MHAYLDATLLPEAAHGLLLSVSGAFYVDVVRPVITYKVQVTYYHSLTKEGPWVVHLTLGSNRGVGRHL